MLAPAGSAAAARPDYAACSGCSLCLLVCPVWRRSRDLALTPHGRAKALQNGVAAADLAGSVESCTLCGACRPVCPEQIDAVDMVIELRRQLPHPPGWLYAKGKNEGQDRRAGEFNRPICASSAPGGRANSPALLRSSGQRFQTPATHREAKPRLQISSTSTFLPGRGLRDQPKLLAKVCALLGTDLQVDEDDGSDISLALEAGAMLPQPRLERFLASLRGSKTIIVADGLLCRYLARWLPQAAIVSLGQALSGHAGVRGGLRATDLYVIEPRAYHADYQRLVKHYDRLRRECGCDLNLDLQRIVVPATARSLPQRLGGIAPDDAAQIGWLLQGRKLDRIVAESCEDYLALTQVAPCAVVHLADLPADANHAHG